MPQPQLTVVPKDEPQFKRLLEDLHDVPVGLGGVHESTLRAILDFVLQADKIDGRHHLFCPLAKPVRIEASVFILRLYAYQSSADVERLRVRFSHVLSNCADCVEEFQMRKWASRSTYLACFDKKLLDNFFTHVDEWEKSVVLAAYRAAPSGTLQSLPPVLVYHSLANPRLLANDEVWNIFENRCQTAEPFAQWPKRPPPGLFLLLVHPSEKVRQWSQAQLSANPLPSSTPLSDDFKQVIAAYGRALLPEKERAGVDKFQADAWESRLSSEPMFWQALRAVLQHCPDEALNLQLTSHASVHRALLGHLNDHGQHFPDVLRIFDSLLRRLGDKIWAAEGDQYPLVAFASVKDNSGLVKILESSDSSSSAWYLDWVEPFLLSVWSKSTFPDVIAKVTSFLCEELHHERFKKWHPAITRSMAKTFLAIISKAVGDAHHERAIRQPFDIYAKLVVTAALASEKHGDSWADARQAARSLLAHILRADVGDIENKARLLAKQVGKAPGSDAVPPLVFGRGLWESTFHALRSAGPDSVLFIVPVLARCSALNELRPESFPAPASSAMRGPFQATLTSINKALEFLHGAADEVVDRFINTNPSPRTLEVMLSQRTAVTAIVSLMCSPATRLQNAAKSIVSQAYGVDATRSDCFRVLLEKSPENVLKALVEVADSFTKWTAELPEVCSMAQIVVLCLVDVLEALCVRPGGLLFEESFLYPNSSSRPSWLLPKLWKSMCRALAAIFQKAPTWSAYLPNEVMVDWMRDALIFGRELLNYRITLETAVQAAVDNDASIVGSSPKKTTDTGRQMVHDLQQLLRDGISWLRLTDSELLYQSHALMTALFGVFRATEVQPEEASIAKLEKFLQKARSNKNLENTTRLSAVALADLEEMLGDFNEDDDESDPEIIEIDSLPTKAVVSADRKRARSPTDDIVSSHKHLKHASSSIVPVKPKASDLLPKRQPIQTVAVDNKTAKQSTLQFARAGSSTKHPLPQKPAARPTSALPPPARNTAAPVSNIPSNLPSRATMLADRNPPIRQAKPPAPAPASDSSDSSSDDDENDTSGIAGLVSLQKSPPKIRKIERRTVKMMESSAGLARRQVLQDRTNERERAVRTKLRLQPDVTPLHRQILAWNFNHTGETPPLARPVQLSRIPQEFESHDQYLKIFEPLLLHECWSQLQRAKEESDASVDCQITAKCFSDPWVDIDLSITELPPKWYLVPEVDVVLLRHPGDAQKSVLAKVQAWGHSQKGPVKQWAATLRVLASRDPGLQHGMTWKVTKVLSLSTLHREFGALVALQHFDLFDDVLRPKPARVPSLEASRVRDAQHNHQVNEPQAKAIIASTQTDGFLLVQGPPGTGKTWTICGMVGAFLSQRPKPIIPVGSTGVKPTPKKLLICAPSNAAIDEVAKRLHDGVLDSQGRRVVPNIVRVGIEASVNASVKDLTLDYLVDVKLAGPNGAVSKPNAQVDTSALSAELASVKAQLDQKFTESAAAKTPAAEKQIQDEIAALKSKRFTISQRLESARDKQKSENRTLDAARRKFRSEVLLEADVVCSTLAGAGHETLEALEFETVIIDEAAQAIELSSLIPLKYGCRRCVMVGDPKQLPPTVLSTIATKYDYNKSLFVRIHDARPDSAHLLSIQYRMHPDISRIPSRLFYGGRLADGENMATKTRQIWHQSNLLGTYRFFNVALGSQENAQAGHSLINRAECDAALGIYEVFLCEYRSVDMAGRVGIISMYKAQIGALKRAFEGRYGPSIIGKIDFNTVDGFQGQEKDIIILSCVRAGHGVMSVGFLKDQRRLNVSITRSRSSLFILGHADTLQRSDETWKTIVDDARDRGVLIDVDRTTFTKSTVSIRPPPAARLPGPSAATVRVTAPANTAIVSSSTSTLNTARVQPSSKRVHEGSSDDEAPTKRRKSDAAAPEPSVRPSISVNTTTVPPTHAPNPTSSPTSSTSAPPPGPPKPIKPRAKKSAQLFIPKSHQRSRP